MRPCCLYQSQLQSNSFHLKRRPCRAPAASSARTPSGITSRPMPSPGITAIECSFMGAQYIESAMAFSLPRFAAIEASTEWCSVALWRDGEISALERRAPNRHSELALPMLERLLQAAGMSLASLD